MKVEELSALKQVYPSMGTRQTTAVLTPGPEFALPCSGGAFGRRRPLMFVPKTPKTGNRIKRAEKNPETGSSLSCRTSDRHQSGSVVLVLLLTSAPPSLKVRFGLGGVVVE